jgi:O-antigen/teichoic acid export membrane protein
MFAVGIIPCVAFMIFAPWLFSLYLGPAWREAGELARILAPMLLMRATVSPLTTVFFFTGRQALDLTLMLISAAIMFVCVSVAWVGTGTAIAIVIAYTVVYFAIYLTYLVFSLQFAEMKGY